MKSFDKLLIEIELFIKNTLKLNIIYLNNLNDPFKGGLDGLNIYIDKEFITEKKVLNLLCLAGHCIQWNTNPHQKNIGSVIYNNPSLSVLENLMQYEYQAFQYSLEILNKTENWKFYSWLNKNCKQNMLNLYNFYIFNKTKKTSKSISSRIFKYQQLRETIKIPQFIPVIFKKINNIKTIV